MINIFIAYSHSDLALKEELIKFLTPLRREERVSIWHDYNIGAGDDWDAKIKEELYSSDIVLLLVSSDALHSDYFYSREVSISQERHHRGEAVVIPIILRHCDWINTPIGGLECIPEKGKPVVEWPTRDQAWQDVVSRIRRVVDSLEARKKQQAKELEVLTRFNAAILSGDHLMDNQRWEEAKVAFNDALALYSSGFNPDKALIKLNINKCDIKIAEEKKLAKRQPVQKSPLDNALKKDDVFENKTQQSNTSLREGNQRPVKEETGGKREKKYDINVSLGASFISLVVFSIHYAARIKYFDYQTPKGYWTTVFLLSFVSAIILGILVFFINIFLTKPNTKLQNAIGAIMLLGTIGLLLYGLYKPIYTHYAFQNNLLIDSRDQSIQQQGSSYNNHIQVDKGASLQDTLKEDNGSSLKIKGDESLSDNSEKVIILEDDKFYPSIGIFSEKKYAFTRLKTIRVAEPNCFVGLCQNDKYFRLILSEKGYATRQQAEKAYANYKNRYETFSIFSCGKK